MTISLNSNVAAGGPVELPVQPLFKPAPEIITSPGALEHYGIRFPSAWKPLGVWRCVERDRDDPTLPGIGGPPGSTPPGSIGGRGGDYSVFDFLPKEERPAAILAYENVLTLFENRHVFPRRVWIDMDGTLIKYRKNGDEPEKIQGYMVGLMQAFYEHGVDIGIFSFWSENPIFEFLTTHFQIGMLIALNSEGGLLIRGAEYINESNRLLASGYDDVSFDYHDGIGYFDFDKEKPANQNMRSIKIIEPGDILVDDDGLNLTYERLEGLKDKITNWDESAFAEAIRISTAGYLHVTRTYQKDPVKYLSAVEIMNLRYILDNLPRPSDVWTFPTLADIVPDTTP